MHHKKTVAVIGGTGKSGKYLLKKIVTRDLRIKALVRNPATVGPQSTNLEIITGDVKDYPTVESLIQGCDAVISTLGLGLPPDEPTLFSKATRHVLRAMIKNRVRRYIVTAGLNVDTPYDEKSQKIKLATAWMYEHFPISTKDRQLEYDLLTESDVDWTLVRLPLIEQTDIFHEIIVNQKDCPSEKISAASLAEFLILQIEDTSFIEKAPFVGNK